MVTPFFLASRKDRFWIVLGIVASIAESVGDPVATILVGRIFKELQRMMAGQILPHMFLSHVRVYSICLVAVAGYTLVMNWIGYMIWVSIGYRQGHRARQKLYHALVMRSAAWYDCRTEISGSAVTYFKDIQDLEMAAGITAYEIMAMAVGFCIEIGVAFYFSWAVTLVCLAGIPVLVLIGSILSPRITQRVIITKSLLDLISERLTWVLGAVQTVKIFQRERYEWAYLHRHIVKYQKATIGYWIIFKLQEGLCRTVVLMIFLQGFYFGSFMVRHHGLDAGNVVTVFFSCLAASGLLQQLVGHLIEWNKGKASAERLVKVLEFEKPEERLYNSIGLMPSNGSTTDARLERLGWTFGQPVPMKELDRVKSSFGAPLDRVNSLDSGLSLDSVSSYNTFKKASNSVVGHIALSDVVFSYPARQEIVLAGLTMEFAPGSLTFILGSSGSGKSTIAALLSKQYPWQAGEITIDSHGVDLLSKQWIERNVYVVEQMPKLFDISLYDNIRIGSRSPHLVTDQQVKEACKISCADFVWSLPKKLQTSGNHPLSGGQIQRISLCRALVNDAPIMVFDEATSALDPDLQLEVMKRLTVQRENKTTIIITHDHSIIPEGFPIYMMNDGLAKRFNSISTLTPVLESTPSLYSSVQGYGSDVPLQARDEYHSAQSNETTSAHTLRPHTLQSDKRALNTNTALFGSIPDKGLFALGLIITTVHAVINPVFSFVFSKLIMGILDPTKSTVILWAMLVLTCAILDGIVTFCAVILNIVGEKWLTSVRETLYNNLLETKNMELLRDQASGLSKLLMSDAEKCAEILTLYWPGLLSMLVLGLVGIIWSMATGWKLTLVGIALIPVFFVTNQSYKWISTRRTAKREFLRAEVVRLLSDLMTPNGFRTLKLQHLEHFFQQFYEKRESKLHSLTYRMVFEIGFGYGTLKSFPYVLEALVLWYGMHLTAHEYYSPQTTMTVFSLIMFTIVTIDQLTSSIGSVGTGFEAADRLMQALFMTKATTKPKISRWQRRSLALGVQALEWNSVSFHRVEVTGLDSQRILRPFSATFWKAETVAIIGPSGAGKSTIARLLLKLQRPSRGEIVIDKRWDLESLNEFEVRRNIAMVSQMPLDFFDGTIEDNLLYALDVNDIIGPTKMVDVCKLCGVHEFISELKDGYNTRMRNGLLSGGQMQRLGIARAVLRMPKILILDECTSALDQDSKHAIMDLIHTLRSSCDMTIVIITHELDVLAIADRSIKLVIN